MERFTERPILNAMLIGAIVGGVIASTNGWTKKEVQEVMKTPEKPLPKVHE